MRILIAPDKFKDALDAEAVAGAIAAGVRDAQPDAEVIRCPLADGGEGTGRLLATALGARERHATVRDPLGRPREACWWSDPAGHTAIIEMAEASGLALLPAAERNALRTTSWGTGQLLQAASAAGCQRVLLCVGGSATVDGGAGCLQALGWVFTTGAGAVLSEPIAGGDLRRISDLRPPPTMPRLELDMLCDVNNPLLGPRGAAPVFASQKGADEAAVVELERGLTNWADVLERDCGMDVRQVPGGGAAGGLPAGLRAALGARLRPGFEEVADCVGLREKLPGCDLCLTGEGRIDEQSVGGKVVGGVARLAAEQGVPTVALAGDVRLRAGQRVEDLAAALGLREIVVITPPGTPAAEALAATGPNLRGAAGRALAAWR